MASKVVSLRLKEREAVYLAHQARRMQRTQGEIAALLLAEKLREEEFPLIEFRNTLSGREPHVRGTRIKVWQVVMYARQPLDAEQIASLLGVPRERIQAALDYHAAYQGEIDAVLEEVDGVTDKQLRRILPNVQIVSVADL